jgi:hypothetical protein
MTQTEKAAEIRNIVANYALHYWRQLIWQIGQFVPGGDMEIGLKHQLDEETIFTHAMEPQEWLTMARYGAGLFDGDEETPSYIYEICQGLAEWQFGIADVSAYGIPDEWKDSPMGALWWAAYIRTQGDELISIAEAAKLAGVSVQAMSQRVDRGTVKAFTDPLSKERQRRRLVRKLDVVKTEE